MSDNLKLQEVTENFNSIAIEFQDLQSQLKENEDKHHSEIAEKEEIIRTLT